MSRVRTVVVDSRQRDTRVHPRASEYVVKLSEELRNVESIELVYAIYSAQGTERYANLFISEVEDRGSVVTMDSAEASGAFTQLPLLDPVNEYTPARHYRSLSMFKIPVSRLPRLTLRFTDAFGSPCPIQDHLLRFEVVCGERQRARESDLVQRLAESDPLLPLPSAAPVAAASACSAPGSRADPVPRGASASEIKALQRLSRSFSELAAGDGCGRKGRSAKARKRV